MSRDAILQNFSSLFKKLEQIRMINRKVNYRPSASDLLYSKFHYEKVLEYADLEDDDNAENHLKWAIHYIQPPNNQFQKIIGKL